MAIRTPASTLVISRTLIPANGKVEVSVAPGAVDIYLGLVKSD